jgi:hypothetical protein
MKINKPDHYSKGIEVIKFLNSWPDISFSVGNVVKYVMRAPYKHDSQKEDLLKALYYLMNEIECKGYKKDAISFLKEKFFVSQSLSSEKSEEVYDSIEQYRAENIFEPETKKITIKEFFNELVEDFVKKNNWNKTKHSINSDTESLVFDTEDGAIVNFRFNLSKETLDIKYKPKKRVRVDREFFWYSFESELEQKYISIPNILEQLNLLEMPIGLLNEDETFQESLNYDLKNVYDLIYLLHEFNGFVSTL